MITMEQSRENAKRGLEWWHSDEAFEARCGQYLAHMLFLNADRRRSPFGLNAPEPEWPAIFVYDITMDEAYWIECNSRTELRDYMRACRPIDMNAAAKHIGESN